jgi:hypothetical protein
MSLRRILPLNSLLEAHDPDEQKILYRLLFVDTEAGEVALINLQESLAWPEWRSLDSLSADVASGTLRPCMDDPFQADTRPDSELSEASKRVRDQRWNVIQPLVDDRAGDPAAILRQHTRGQLVLAAHKESGTAPDKIRAWLKLYWRGGQTKNALLPGYERSGGRGKRKRAGSKKRGRPSKLALAEPGQEGMNVTEQVRKLLIKGWKRFYRKKYRGRTLNFAEAYQQTLESFFYDRLAFVDGNLVPILREQNELPTRAQFVYWIRQYRRTDAKAEAELAARIGERRLALRHRAVLGSSEHLSRGPGDLFLIDATVGDIFLLSSIDRRRVIGRPVIYLVIDHWSRMIVGMYVGLEGPSWVGAMMALENVMADKVAFCAKYGVEIAPEEWPCEHLPHQILADRGELIGEVSDQLVDLFRIQMTNTPPFRADFKSFVEGQFKITNERGIKRQPGWVDKARDRGDRDYRLDATLDLDYFNRMMIYLVLHNNSARRLEKQVPIGYPISRDRNPVPMDLWEWGLENRMGMLRTMDRDRVRVNLLPTMRARATPNGFEILSGALHYDSVTAREQGWFLRGTGHTPPSFKLALDPRDVSVGYLRLDQGRNIEECPLTAKHRPRWAGKTLEEVLDDRDRRDTTKQKDRGQRHQDTANLNAYLDAVTEEAEKAREAALGPASDQPSVEGIREARREQRRANQESEAFTPDAIDRRPDVQDDDEMIRFPD